MSADLVILKTFYLLLALRLAASAAWFCSFDLEGDPANLLGFKAASMHCQTDTSQASNLTVFVNASLLPFAPTFKGQGSDLLVSVLSTV